MATALKRDNHLSFFLLSYFLSELNHVAMMMIERPSHVLRVRQAHKNALRVLFAREPIAPPVEKEMIARLTEYHITRLHKLWFSSSRREKQC